MGACLISVSDMTQFDRSDVRRTFAQEILQVFHCDLLDFVGWRIGPN